MKANFSTLSHLQIREQTQDCLILQSNRGSLVITLMGSGIFLFILGLSILSFGTLTVLKCTRETSSLQPQQSICQIIESRLFDSRTRVIIPVNQIQKAIFDHQVGKILLLTHNDKIFLTSPVNGTKLTTQESKALTQINAFIDQPQSTTLLVQFDGRDRFYVQGGMIIAAAMVGLFSITGLRIRTTCVFNRDKGEMILINQTLFSRNSLTCNLEDILSIKIQEKRDMVYAQRLLAYQIVLILKNRDYVLIEESCPTAYKNDCVHLVNKIREFLNLTDCL